MGKGRGISVRTLDRDMGLGRDRPEQKITVNMVVAVSTVGPLGENVAAYI